MLPIGIHSCCENFAGQDALAGIETCDISDYCWTLGYMVQITGDAKYLDKIEKIMYNIAPGVVDQDFKSLQYFSAPNQVISTHYSNHTQSFTQTPRMAYQANHYPECCSGNVNRSMPNFIYRALMKDDEAYYINFYIPGHYEVDNIAFDIVTNYPYDEKIEIIYQGTNQVLNLNLRIPHWCKNFTYHSNHQGKIVNHRLNLKGLFEKGEKIVLTIKSEVEVKKTSEGFLVTKEPLIFTLDIEYQKTIDQTEPRQTKDYPAYDIIPLSKWQIALDKKMFEKTYCLHKTDVNNILQNDYYLLAKGFYMDGVDLVNVNSADVPISDYDQVELVKLKRMGQIIYDGPMKFTPAIKDLHPTSIKSLDIKLIPYARATLRWTIFPNVKKISL